MTITKITKDVSGIGYGLVVITPADTQVVNPPLVMFLHGLGEQYRSDRTNQANIDALANAIPTNLKTAVDKYKFVAVCPQTPYVWNMGEVNAALGWADKNVPYDRTRRYLTGLSLGGGGTIYFLKSSLDNAKLFHAAAPIATTRQYSGNTQYIVDANVPMWLFHNLNDTNGGTPVGATNEVYEDILKRSPITKPTKTIFNASGHGGWGEAYNPNTPPVAPGGQGLTNANVTLYDWFLMNSETKRVAVPTSTPPATTITAVAGVTVNGKIESAPTFSTVSDTIDLNAGLSQNAKSFNWRVTLVPDGVSIWQPIIVSGAAWITGRAKFPKEGTYEIVLTSFANSNYTGASATDTLTIVYMKDGTPPPPPVKQLLQKVFVPKNNNYVYVYDDGSTETKSE